MMGKVGRLAGCSSAWPDAQPDGRVELRGHRLLGDLDGFQRAVQPVAIDLLDRRR